MKILFYILIFQLFLFEKVYANYAINVDFFNRFNDCYFVEYIKEALENNHDLKQANQKVLQYRFEISNQFSKELPSLSVGSNYLGNHFPTGDTNFLIKRNSYILPFLVNFEPDLLLKNKDKTKSAKKLFEAQLANQKGTYISLLSDVSNAYIKSPSAMEHAGFSAGSYKDLTRVAKLNEHMWTELFLENGENLVNEIDGLVEQLLKYSKAIKENDADTLRELLKDGREKKAIIDGEIF